MQKSRGDSVLIEFGKQQVMNHEAIIQNRQLILIVNFPIDRRSILD